MGWTCIAKFEDETYYGSKVFVENQNFDKQTDGRTGKNIIPTIFKGTRINMF